MTHFRLLQLRTLFFFTATTLGYLCWTRASKELTFATSVLHMWFPWNELLMCMSKRLIWSIPRPPMELKEGDISHQRNLRRMEKLRCQMLLKKGQWGGSWPWWWPQHQPFYCSAYNQDLCSYTDQDFFHINRGVMSTVMFLVKIAFILKTCL